MQSKPEHQVFALVCVLVCAASLPLAYTAPASASASAPEAAPAAVPAPAAAAAAAAEAAAPAAAPVAAAATPVEEAAKASQAVVAAADVVKASVPASEQSLAKADAADPAAASRSAGTRATPISNYLNLLYSTYSYYCVPNGQFTIATYSGSMDLCAQACLMRTDCAFFSYYLSGVCELKYAVSGYAFASRRSYNTNCTTYYKRFSRSVSSLSIADGRSFFEYIPGTASFESATDICRNRGMHLADIRSSTERIAATSTYQYYIWMNLLPSYSQSTSYFRYRDDKVSFSSYVSQVSPNGAYSSGSTQTAYCLGLYTSYYFVADCTSVQNVVCQYSDLDRF